MLQRFLQPSPSKLNDQELLSRFKQTGNSSLLGELYARYTHLVFGVCLKYFKDEDEAQDAVIQIFEFLLEKVPQSEIENFKGWLYQVAKTQCLMALRKKKSIAKRHEAYEKETKDAVESQAFAHPIEEEEQHVAKVEQLKEAVSHLKEEQRQCVELFFFEEQSYQEIAESTGYSVKSVKSHLQNGKRNLKKALLESGLWGWFIHLFWIG